ncbi:cytochrome P450 [Polyporus arcularius HHB13444]|uniref:Cytochrome P450 n=1 Tax=Polyporus arcularius HHB13444 TaxID=1314778 RepID=A0A5C3PB45_9APHY|nr:cytochrome P450 [Polyporus arcularius HHB13444]
MNRDFVLYAVTALLVFLGWRLSRARQRRYPPGPPPALFTGNLKDIPRGGHEWEAYTALGKKYGDVVHFNVFGSHVVVLNSYEATRDLLDARGSIYSSRPRLVMLKEVKRWDWNLVIMSYDKRYQTYRRIVQQEFQPSVVTRSHHSLMALEIANFLGRLLTSQQDLPKHVRRLAGAIIMRITYGHKVVSADDPFVSLAEAVRETNEKTPGNAVVDLLPFLKHLPAWFPGGGFQRQAAYVRELSRKMRSVPFEAVKAQMASGKAESSMATRLIESEDIPSDMDRDQLAMDCTGVVYSAGADTTVATLLNFVHAMTLYPEVQARAQQEIDAVIGRDRLPTFDDRKRLPYLSNVVKEAFRWKPSVMLCVPHTTISDDEYRGMYIPKGASVIANIWAMLHDENVYKSPYEFDPDRFTPSSDHPEGEPDPAKIAFGYGRRICPGRYFADDSVFLAVTSMLQLFRISLPEGVKKKDVKVTWSSGLVSLPSAYPYTLTPRFEGVRELIATSSEVA